MRGFLVDYDLVDMASPGDSVAVRTADFDYQLPKERIAQVPAPQREGSRLMILHRESHTMSHRVFRDLPDLLAPGDVLVLNNSRVIPARLRARNPGTNGRFELLLLEEVAVNDWWAMVRPGKRAKVGTELTIHGTRQNAGEIRASVIETNDEGHRRLRFSNTPDIIGAAEKVGEVPLPPYIDRDQTGPRDADRERYQTVYAKAPGSVAAPTAGLHFSKPLLARIQARGVSVCFVTLHVGLGTFAPVKTENIEAHNMHEERFEVPENTARLVSEAKAEQRRVVSVGTTALRVLESVAALHRGQVVAGAGKTSIFLYPPCEFRIADALLTNFHLPRSTLLMLACAFAAPRRTEGRDLILQAYAEAIHQGYRFYSYGDAMLII